MKPTNSYNQGMALILTLITVSAIITITVSMIGLSLQQLQLSVDARDSERAFHAASAGLECGQFVRSQQSDTVTTYESSDGPITLNCMNETDSSTGTVIPPNTSGDVSGAVINEFFYQIEPSFSGRDTCVEVDISIMRSAESVPMSHDFGGQTGLVSCEESSVCTVVVSRGYNRPDCNVSGTGNYEVVREINAIF